MFYIDPLITGEEQFAPGEHPHTGPSAQGQVRGLQHQLLTPRQICTQDSKAQVNIKTVLVTSGRT
jgi:hypothetical protein